MMEFDWIEDIDIVHGTYIESNDYYSKKYRVIETVNHSKKGLCVRTMRYDSYDTPWGPTTSSSIKWFTYNRFMEMIDKGQITRA